MLTGLQAEKGHVVMIHRYSSSIKLQGNRVSGSSSLCCRKEVGDSKRRKGKLGGLLMNCPRAVSFENARLKDK